MGVSRTQGGRKSYESLLLTTHQAEHQLWWGGQVNLDLPTDSVASELVTVGKFLRLFVSRDLYLLSGKENNPL